MALCCTGGLPKDRCHRRPAPYEIDPAPYQAALDSAGATLARAERMSQRRT